MEKVGEIRIEDFDYVLPDERIPRHPLRERAACKLLLSRPDGKISHRRFSELASLLPPGSMMVCNDTKVINARLSFTKSTGARIEIFLLEPREPADYLTTFQTTERCVWNCMIGNLKKWKGEPLYATLHNDAGEECTLKATRLKEGEGQSHEVEFTWTNPKFTFADIIENVGCIPIPPYLKRETEESDKTDYQTVYAEEQGSVAAPTAGLHFTEEVFDDLRAHNIDVEKLTLHVGAGTFQPVKSETIGDHPMHTETFTVTRRLLRRLIASKEAGTPIVAVGTTTVRTLESLPYLALRLEKGEPPHVDQWMAYSEEAAMPETTASLKKLDKIMEERGLEALKASTAIMIAPGFRWRLTDVMVTNFHQPQSTLLLLVSSFLGGAEKGERWRKIYEEALHEDYRFLSYGDACLLFHLNDQADGAPLPDKDKTE